MKLSEQVRDFHHAMGQPVLERPEVPNDERVRLRLRLIAEEFMELLNATLIFPSAALARQLQGIIDTAPIAVDLVDMTDALADLDYVIEGTRAEFGIHGEPIAALVHESNMAKLGGKVDASGKIQKPAGWQPPAIHEELVRQGWSGE